MAHIPVAIGAALISGAAGLATSVLMKPKAPAAPKVAPAPAATPRANSAISDALAKRRGAAANQVTGAGGAESATAAKKSFMGT